ncbi:hypothetical protein QBC43DRAFT_310264 [Cladorrhinum sp. PSN259]|nr:hypothetical protein QBC43DRAFT_310264 [Cladorrhinum sp. PSN259]
MSVDNHLKVQLPQQIWPELGDPNSYSGMHNQYARLFDYLDHEITSMRRNLALFAISHPPAVLSLIPKLKALGNGIRRTEAIDMARNVNNEQDTSDATLMRSVDVAIRLWLTLDVSSLDLRRPGLISWTSKETLAEAVQSHFASLVNDQSRTLSSQYGRIDPELTAEFLVKYRGYTITWTDNLAAHLTIDWKNKTLTIYEHKICLSNHLRFSTSCVIPEDVLGEAIDTLNLLFPFQNDSTKRFLTKHKKPFYGLGFCGRPRKLIIGDYSYWRSRIADLVHILAGPPVGLQQLGLYYKGENLLQFATFWIATAVGVLTLLSIALGVAAIVYGVKQYDLALKQYEVSVLQLCLDPEAERRFAHVCSRISF